MQQKLHKVIKSKMTAVFTVKIKQINPLKCTITLLCNVMKSTAKFKCAFALLLTLG